VFLFSFTNKRGLKTPPTLEKNPPNSKGAHRPRGTQNLIGLKKGGSFFTHLGNFGPPHTPPPGRPPRWGFFGGGASQRVLGYFFFPGFGGLGFRLERGSYLVYGISLSKGDDFFDTLSWRTKFGWDRDSLNGDLKFQSTVGAGYSWGNDLGYIYTLVDPFIYDNLDYGVGASFGFQVDKYKYLNLKMEFQKKFYQNSKEQNIINLSNGFNLSSNKQLILNYKYNSNIEKNTQESFNIMFKCFF